MDLATTRRNLRQRLSVYRVDGCMPVPTATLTALLDALDVADADVAQYRSLAKAAIESDMESLTRLDAAEAQVQRVRALHVAYYPFRDGRGYCGICEGDEFDPYPCSTIRAINEEVTL